MQPEKQSFAAKGLLAQLYPPFKQFDFVCR